MILFFAGLVAVVYSILVVLGCIVLFGASICVLISGVVGLVASSARRKITTAIDADAYANDLRCDAYGNIVEHVPETIVSPQGDVTIVVDKRLPWHIPGNAPSKKVSQWN